MKTLRLAIIGGAVGALTSVLCDHLGLSDAEIWTCVISAS